MNTITTPSSEAEAQVAVPESSFAVCTPTPEEEKETIDTLTRVADENAQDGDLRYLVDHKWWIDWQNYIGSNSSGEGSSNGPVYSLSRPGEIDNSKLVLEGASSGNDELELRDYLLEGEDYTLVPQEVWRKLHEWYNGGPELPRKVIVEGLTSKNYTVDVYPLRLKLIGERDNSIRIIKISRKAKVSELYDMVCSLLGVQQDKVDIWDYYSQKKDKKLTYLYCDQTLEDVQLLMDQEIFMEEKADNSWPTDIGSTTNQLALIPSEPSTSSYSIAGGPSMSNGYSSLSMSNGYSGYGSSFLQGSYNSFSRDVEDGYSSLSNGAKVGSHGLSGLHNLGNTCFMNSAIQSLVHTSPLVEYFLNDYNKEINKENPLGMQGELAIAFGELLRKLWSGHASVAPRAFKSKLSRFAPQFSGFNQHDSQELLAFLLDGLHEDLNRVKKKPYIEVKDCDGRPDEDFAEECWQSHKARNDSIIVDKFQGQYKSTLVCPNCGKVSVTFDPFMYLSLPLPSIAKKMMTVTVISGTGDGIPLPFTVTVPKSGCCGDLIKALNIACGLNSSESLLLAEIYENRIFRYIQNPSESLEGIREDDKIVAYRLPAGHDRLLRVEIMHRRIDRYYSEHQFTIHRKLVGTPLVTCMSNSSTRKADIYAAVSAVLAPLMRPNVSGSKQPASKMNGYGYGPSSESIVLTDNVATCSSDNDVSASKMEEEKEKEDEEGAGQGEEEVDELPSFQLAITDEKGNSRMSIQTDSNRVLGFTLRLLMDWSGKELETYDFTYIENIDAVFKPGYLSKKIRQEAVTLFSCLEAFLKEEPLGPDDMWYCPSCKEHRQATKKLDLWRLPEILVVHLKRFSYNRYMKNKLDILVNFPIHNLDLSKYVQHAATTNSHRPLYELYAVINHYGGLGGGHYSAYAKLVEGDSWHHFDDSHVSPVDEEDVKTSAAYVLFYRRVEAKPTEMAKAKTASTDGVPMEVTKERTASTEREPVDSPKEKAASIGGVPMEVAEETTATSESEPVDVAMGATASTGGEHMEVDTKTIGCAEGELVDGITETTAMHCEPMDLDEERTASTAGTADTPDS